MSGFLAAWRFLTVLGPPGGPGGPEGNEERSFRAAPAWFPVVGCVLGVGVACADRALQGFFPIPVRSAIDLVLLIAWTGGLHMDGLADTADGFLSARPRERILEIMHDSRSGAMAVVTVGATFLLQWTALTALTSNERVGALVLAPVLGRCAILLLMNRLPYARAEGLASSFAGGARGWPWITGFLFALALGGLFFKAGGACLVLGGLGFAWLFSRYCARKIGGYTGDTLGAACELTATAALLIAVALQSRGGLP